VPRPPAASPQTRLVLDLLGREPTAWRYGYELSHRSGLKSGTLYPILMRLAERGWLETCWTEPERPGRPPRHTYRLTADGARAAAAALERAEPARLVTLAHAADAAP
jgi:PadR family transcriptional regulator, regulatory protein PadR